MSQPNYTVYADAVRQIAHLETQLAELRQMYADLARQIAERDAPLVAYSTDSLTTYTPAGERLVLAASLPY